MNFSYDTKDTSCPRGTPCGCHCSVPPAPILCPFCRVRVTAALHARTFQIVPFLWSPALDTCGLQAKQGMAPLSRGRWDMQKGWRRGDSGRCVSGHSWLPARDVGESGGVQGRAPSRGNPRSIIIVGDMLGRMTKPKTTAGSSLPGPVSPSSWVLDCQVQVMVSPQMDNFPHPPSWNPSTDP